MIDDPTYAPAPDSPGDARSEDRLENLWGNFPQVTTTPTWHPSQTRDSMAMDTTKGVLYYYDFTNLVWKSTQFLTAPSGTIVGTTDTQTLTNKRITKRVLTIGSAATPTINTDNYDCVTITALAADITSMSSSLSGTPTNFQTLIIRILDNGTARAITWGASFAAKGVALPTTTVISKLLTVGFIYDTVATTWGCIASAQET